MACEVLLFVSRYCSINLLTLLMIIKSFFIKLGTLGLNVRDPLGCLYIGIWGRGKGLVNGFAIDNS